MSIEDWLHSERLWIPDMPTDLNERLVNYRRPLDDAIASDLASRPANGGYRHPIRGRVVAGVGAVVLVAAGIGALVWTSEDRPTTPSGSVLIDQPETTVTDSVMVVTPEPTAPPASIAPPPLETPAPANAVIDQLALGDSIMLGAAPQLADSGFVVDAVESRAFVNGLDTILAFETQGRLGDVVVVQLGMNGPISSSDMTQMMEALAGVPQVLLLTTDAPRDYTGANNSLIYDTAATYPNVSLLDWAGLDDACPGDCFYNDGYHMRPDGARYYAALINAAIEHN